MNVLNHVTLRTLKENRVRTAVTIIGVILSAAMITAVTSFITSLQNYMIEYEILHNGNWHVELDCLSGEMASRLEEDSRVEHLDWIQNVGYTKLKEQSTNGYPYIHVMGFSEDAMETLPVRITEGRLPENSREIVLSDYVNRMGKTNFEVGQELTFDMGWRYSPDGELLTPRGKYQEEEKLVATEERTYTLVGFCENPSYQSSVSPGYAGITWADEGASLKKDCLSYYLRLENPKDAYTVLKEYGNLGESNQGLLLYLNVSAYSGFHRVLYSMGTILMTLILIGSVSLIYNAFSISVGERTRQFGILSSVGATKKQLASSVRFEALAIGAIGVPLGIGSGLLGAWITLSLLSDKFTYLAGEGTMHLYVTWQGIAIAFVIAWLALFLSVWTPARRAARMSAMDAIRQTKDIQIRPQKRRTGRLAYRLFGLSGLLAAKNFKRNRRGYRSTVISLFLSIVLFLSASSFVQYLSAGVDGGTGTSNYDLEYYSEKEDDVDSIYQILKEVPGVERSSRYQAGYFEISLGRAFLDDTLVEYLDRKGGWNLDSLGESPSDQAYWNLRTVFLEDEMFRQYAAELGLDVDAFADPHHPQAIALNQYWDYDGEQDAFRKLQILKGNAPADVDVSILDFSETGEVQNMLDWGVSIGTFAEEPPMGIHVSRYVQTLILIYPKAVQEAVVPRELSGKLSNPVLQFIAEDADAVCQEMTSILKSQKVSGSLYNQAEREESSRDMLEIVHVFSYGFIVLISLIAAANVFHTISTNLHLRRREFAMLKSVGMTEKGLQRMMYYECLCYGGKSLFYGLPVAFGINYLLYRSMDAGVEVGFQIPWVSLAISIGSVFLVVIATMLYALGKLKKENTVDILKQENG
ncbi:FtsX-like permease family protein [Hominifimenecus sp. rT4P-3]|uniref:FtsX-like permease family protein n=1 Tax=Hominifimenecus sp. rT4P-3 TaxID=3242979 RepID=UPI003DA51841